MNVSANRMNSFGPNVNQEIFSTIEVTEDVKVVLLGSTSVGKTSLVLRYVQGNFSPSVVPTVGASFLSKTVWINDKRIRLQLWDTAGQERFRSLAPMYYRGAAAALLLFDMTKAHTFEEVKGWVKELKSTLIDDILLFVVATHSDLGSTREVPVEVAQEYAESIGAVGYFETSAREDLGISELFLEVAKAIVQEDLINTKESLKTLPPPNNSNCVC